MQVHPWNPEEEKLLGRISDEAAAIKLGRTLTAVALRRARLGIPISHPKHKSWQKSELRLLAKHSNQEVARLLNRSVASVAHARVRCGIASPRRGQRA